MFGWNFIISSAHAGSSIDSGASTSILPPLCTKESNTALVLPVPGSDVIKQRGVLRIKSVVTTWCSYGLSSSFIVLPFLDIQVNYNIFTSL